ncbi:Gamma-aminobutyric acid receptor subunit beta [Portunus trituberculatus]|uniref:Gamma-aminobutyric acid receptor subunit beta n=1 Tax=Portunus trituberculatus TaxID=210409 RepID=A0A5B7I363_PORTR|nr:Gamma-aminobutyric acid receptor subunit beta [Portunus trituberculatus]
MDFYFRQYWTDPRLDFSAYKGLNEIQVSTDYTNKIWVPDTFFPNEKRAYYHTATTPNELLRISSNGNVLRSIRRGAVCSNPLLFSSLLPLSSHGQEEEEEEEEEREYGDSS